MTLNLKNYSSFSLWKLVFCILILFVYTQTNGQETANDTIHNEENLLNDSSDVDTEYSYMNFDLSYTNNKINSKRQIATQIPGLLGEISYYHKTGFYTDLSIIDYINSETLTLDYDLSVGYQKKLNSFFDFDLYYNYHGFSGDTLYKGIDYNNSVGLSLGLTLKSINVFADGYYYNGVTNNYFIDFGFSTIEQFDDIFTKNDYILFQPIVSAACGTDYWLYENLRPWQKQLKIYYINSKGYSTNNFEYQGLDIILPISYGISDISFMFAWMYYIPSDKFKAIGWTNQSGYMISLSYMLDFE